jgi:hypothetical protein
MRRALLSLAKMAVSELIIAGVASTITHGRPDGNKHPNAGALVGTLDGQTYPIVPGPRSRTPYS